MSCRKDQACKELLSGLAWGLKPSNPKADGMYPYPTHTPVFLKEREAFSHLQSALHLFSWPFHVPSFSDPVVILCHFHGRLATPLRGRGY